MSLVICCATSEYGIIMSDSRATDPTTCEVLSENKRKIVKFNDTLVIGYGGLADYCEAVLSDVTNCSPVQHMTMDDASHAILAILESAFEQSSIELDYSFMGFYVLGRTDDGRIAFDTIRSDITKKSIRVLRTIPKDGERRVSAFGASIDSPIAKINQAIDKLGLMDGLQSIFPFVASQDCTVNTKTRYHSVGNLPR